MLTTPTFRPKLRRVPRMSLSMSSTLRWSSLRLVSSMRCSCAASGLDMHRFEQAHAHHLGNSAGVIAVALVDLLRLEQRLM